MQDPKYAGKYGVEQQLKLLSKWLAETGFGEASMLVSAAAISVYEATHKKSATQVRNRSAATTGESSKAEAPPRPLEIAVIEQKRRA